VPQRAEDDGKGIRGALGSKGRGATYGQNYIDTVLDQLSSERRVGLATAVRPPVFQADILPFHVAELLERLPEGRKRVARARRVRAQDTNPRNLSRLLRLGGERRGEEPTREHTDERPTLHYSIT